MKIAIEGMDGVGKSTIAKELAKRNDEIRKNLCSGERDCKKDQCQQRGMDPIP